MERSLENGTRKTQQISIHPSKRTQAAIVVAAEGGSGFYDGAVRSKDGAVAAIDPPAGQEDANAAGTNSVEEQEAP